MNKFSNQITKKEIENTFPELNILKIIKSGGEGLVAKVTYKENPSLNLALKIYFPDHLQKRNLLEVEKLSKMSSDNIVKLFSYGNKDILDNDCFYTLTSFIDGPDLRTLLNNNYKFSIEQVKHMILCISDAIQELWNEKVVHCDIKPDNILYDGKNFILIDLGIAKYIDEPTMTAIGCIMGTLGYIAPEQIQGRRNLTLKADFYSLGIVAYELITGSHPFNFNQNLIMENVPMPTIPNSICSDKKLINTITALTNNVVYKRPFNNINIKNLLN